MSRPSPTEIAVRAYSEKLGRKPVGSKPPRTALDDPSPWTLVFDCETATDASQRLRFGFFQVRKIETFAELKREGVFYDPEAMTETELVLLDSYTKQRGLELMTVAAFRSDVFLKVAFEYRGTVVGFNLPF